MQDMQPAWLANLLARRTPRPLHFDTLNENGALTVSPRRGSDELISRLLDEAANQRQPIGLFDPRETGLHGASGGSFLPRSSTDYPQPNGTDALVQRLLDSASRREPIGLPDTNGGLPTDQRSRAQRRPVPDRYWSPERFQNSPEYRSALDKNTKEWGGYAIANMAAPLAVESAPAVARFVAKNGSTIWDLGELGLEISGIETGHTPPRETIRLPPYTMAERGAPYSYPPGPGGLSPPRPRW